MDNWEINIIRRGFRLSASRDEAKEALELMAEKLIALDVEFKEHFHREGEVAVDGGSRSYRAANNPTPESESLPPSRRRAMPVTETAVPVARRRCLDVSD